MDRRLKAATKHTKWKRLRFFLSASASFRVLFWAWVPRSAVVVCGWRGGETGCIRGGRLICKERFGNPLCCSVASSQQQNQQQEYYREQEGGGFEGETGQKSTATDGAGRLTDGRRENHLVNKTENNRSAHSSTKVTQSSKLIVSITENPWNVLSGWKYSLHYHLDVSCFCPKISKITKNLCRQKDRCGGYW